MPVQRTENIAPLVHSVRGERVLFDADLAALYGVEARVLNQAVKRNRLRFPDDFMFRLSTDEANRASPCSPSNRQLARKIEALEKKYDEQFAIVFDAIKRLIAEDDVRKALPKRRIGF